MRVLASVLVGFQLVACASLRRTESGDTRRIPVSGATLAYAVDGSGPPLVIIHGAFGDLRSFSGAVPELAKHRTVVRVSLRHHWPNAAPESEAAALEDYQVEKHAADLIALMQQLGPAVVVGHSYGGLVAVRIAEARPDLVARLVLVEPSLHSFLRQFPASAESVADQQEWAEDMLARTREGQDPREFARVMFDDTRPGKFDSFPESRRAIFLANGPTFRPALSSLIHEWTQVPYTCDDARRLAMPVLLVEGEKTGAAMQQIGSCLLSCLPDARRVVLRGASHAIQFDAPDAMAREIVRFISP